jgi:hypothetical protein
LVVLSPKQHMADSLKFNIGIEDSEAPIPNIFSSKPMPVAQP